MANKLNVVDFGMFLESMKALTGAVNGFKLIVGKEQTKVLSKNPVSRIKMTTNALTSDEDIDFCISDAQKFVKILEIFKDKIDDNDKVLIEIDRGFIKLKSKKVKAKYGLVKERIIESDIDKEFTGVLNETARFKTTRDNITELHRSAFIFPDIQTAKIYLYSDENNSGKLKAELSNRNNPYSNLLMYNFGDIQSGSIDVDIILNFDRLEMFMLLDGVDDIELSVPDMKALCSNQKIEKDDIFVKLFIISSIMKG